MKRKLILILTLLSAFLAGCSALGGPQPTPTLDLNAIRTMAAATALNELTRIASLSTPTPSETPTETPAPTQPPTPTKEVVLNPIVGLATTNVTVRSEPRKGSTNLGGVFFNQKVSVLARNDVATWYYILWQDSPDGHAWITAKGIELQGSDITQLPIAELDDNNNITFLPPFLWDVGTPLPVPSVPAAGAGVRTATVNSPANVRVCPSIGCMILGILPYGQAVNMTGRYGDNEWAQIDYPSGPGGKAWIASDVLVRSSEGFGGLDYYNVLATPITPEPPTPTLDPNITPTATDTPEPTPAGPQAMVDGETIIYAQPSSLSTQVGTLKTKDVIYITGISINGLWYQIEYPPLTANRAYVSQKYIRILGDARHLPYFDDKGNLLPTP